LTASNAVRISRVAPHPMRGWRTSWPRRACPKTNSPKERSRRVSADTDSRRTGHDALQYLPEVLPKARGGVVSDEDAVVPLTGQLCGGLLGPGWIGHKLSTQHDPRHCQLLFRPKGLYHRSGLGTPMTVDRAHHHDFGTASKALVDNHPEGGQDPRFITAKPYSSSSSCRNTRFQVCESDGVDVTTAVPPCLRFALCSLAGTAGSCLPILAECFDDGEIPRRVKLVNMASQTLEQVRLHVQNPRRSNDGTP
jgi:hypothetical protein